MLAGLPAEEDLAEPVRKSVQKRIPWLGVLLIIGLFVSATVGISDIIPSVFYIRACARAFYKAAQFRRLLPSPPEVSDTAA